MIDQDIQTFTKPKNLKNPTTQKPSVSIFCGPTGAGKSTWMLNWLSALEKDNKYQKALFVTSNKIDPLIDILSDDIQVTNDIEELTSFIAETKQMTRKELDERPSIIVFDDCQGSSVININNNKMLNQFVLSHRHYNCHLVFCVQSWKNSMSTAIRKMMSLAFIFPPRNEGELQSILSDLPISKEKVKKAFEVVKQEPHTPLYINLQEKQPQMFKGFRSPITSFV